MNKYFNKALFFTEKKNMVRSTLGYSLFYLFGILYMLQGIVNVPRESGYIPPNPLNWLEHYYQILIIVAVVSVLRSYKEKEKKYYFMLTQPYTRDSIIITKTISFILPYLGTTIIYGIVTLILVLINKNYYQFDYYGSSLGTLYQKATFGFTFMLLAIIMILTFVAIFLQLMQMLFRKAVASLILPIAVYIMLTSSLNVGVTLLSGNLGVVKTVLKYITIFLFSLSAGSGDGLVIKSLPYIILNYLSNPNIFGSLIILIASVFLLWLTLLLNRRIKPENISNRFLFKGSEKTFRIVCTLAVTIIGSQIILEIIYILFRHIKGISFQGYLISAYGVEHLDTIMQNIYLVLNVLWIPIFILIYKGLEKLADKRRCA